MPKKSSPRFHQEAIRPIKLPLSDAESFGMKSFWFAQDLALEITGNASHRHYRYSLPVHFHEQHVFS